MTFVLQRALWAGIALVSAMGCVVLLSLSVHGNFHHGKAALSGNHLPQTYHPTDESSYGTFWVNRSFVTHVPTAKVVLPAFLVSSTIAVLCLILSITVAIPLGIFLARHCFFRETILFVIYSVPAFAVAIAGLIFFSQPEFAPWVALGGLTSENFERLSFWSKATDLFRHLWLPIVCQSTAVIASLTLLVRDSARALAREFFLTALRAKGLNPARIWYLHILRNALVPVVGNLRSLLMSLLAGGIVIESLFGIRGLGLTLYEAVLQRDHPIVFGVIFVLVVTAILVDLVADLCLAFLDPRVRVFGR